MTLIRWRPTRNLENIQDEVNRVFESFFNAPMRRRGEDVSGRYPDVDIVEDKDNIEVQVDLPGMEKGDIKVSVEDNILTIKGYRTRGGSAQTGKDLQCRAFTGPVMPQQGRDFSPIHT